MPGQPRLLLSGVSSVNLSRSVLVYVVVALCAASISCSPPGNRSADEAAIRAASREWSDAEAGKDLEKCLSFYAEDGKRFATGSPLIVGRDALRKEWAKYLSAPGSFHWTTSTVEVAGSGDLAYEIGVFVIKTVDKNQQPTTINGKYVLVWKKQASGEWKVVADIDNPDS
jgi:uncharacterized protein (TIGR02246 family)